MIVDVSSELPDVELRAHDSRGGSYVLQPGRNFLPVTAYRTGALQIDFHGRAAPAASIQPAMLDYHLNKGGVAYGKVEVLSTFTVMGHLKDTAGNPLAGAHVINHAGRSVAEADGFFALEMSATTPTSKCATRRWPVATSRWTAPPPALRVTRLAGILQCPPSDLTGRSPVQAHRLLEQCHDHLDSLNQGLPTTAPGAVYTGTAHGRW